MKKLIAVFVLLITVCMTLSGCGLLNSANDLLGGGEGGTPANGSSVFELYASIEFDMGYEDVVALFGVEGTVYGEYDDYIEYEWIWEANDVEETVIVEFNDDEIESKRYYIYGDIYSELAAFDLDMWQSIDDGIYLDEFLALYGKYVTLESHSVYKRYSGDLSVYTTYENLDNDASYSFDFMNDVLESKYYYVRGAYDSPDKDNNIISQDAYLQIEQAVEDETPLTYEEVCAIAGSNGVLYNIYVFYSEDSDPRVWEEYLWWTFSGDTVYIEFIDGELDSFY